MCNDSTLCHGASQIEGCRFISMHVLLPSNGCRDLMYWRRNLSYSKKNSCEQLCESLKFIYRSVKNDVQMFLFSHENLSLRRFRLIVARECVSRYFFVNLLFKKTLKRWRDDASEMCFLRNIFHQTLLTTSLFFFSLPVHNAPCAIIPHSPAKRIWRSGKY